MDEYKVVVYDNYTGKYYATKSVVDNYYDGVIETIAAAKANHSKAALVQDGRIVYIYAGSDKQ